MYCIVFCIIHILNIYINIVYVRWIKALLFTLSRKLFYTPRIFWICFDSIQELTFDFSKLNPNHLNPHREKRALWSKMCGFIGTLVGTSYPFRAQVRKLWPVYSEKLHLTLCCICRPHQKKRIFLGHKVQQISAVFFQKQNHFFLLRAHIETSHGSIPKRFRLNLDIANYEAKPFIYIHTITWDTMHQMLVHPNHQSFHVMIICHRFIKRHCTIRQAHNWKVVAIRRHTNLRPFHSWVEDDVVSKIWGFWAGVVNRYNMFFKDLCITKKESRYPWQFQLEWYLDQPCVKIPP